MIVKVPLLIYHGFRHLRKLRLAEAGSSNRKLTAIRPLASIYQMTVMVFPCSPDASTIRHMRCFYLSRLQWVRYPSPLCADGALTSSCDLYLPLILPHTGPCSGAYISQPLSHKFTATTCPIATCKSERHCKDVKLRSNLDRRRAGAT
jgi:hypothetical protein